MKEINQNASALGKLAKGVKTKRKTESSRLNAAKARAAKLKKEGWNMITEKDYNELLEGAALICQAWLSGEEADKHVLKLAAALIVLKAVKLDVID